MENTLLKLSVPVLFALAAPALHAQTARVQVIHNCADAAAAQVDVYLSGVLLLDNFAFRSATPFVDAPAGFPISVAVAPANSTSASDAIYTQNYTLSNGGTYILVADGIVSPTGYMPVQPFTLEVYDMGREVAAGGAGETDVLVHHGSTDAPTVDVYESAVVNTTIVDNASYGDFAGYLELPTSNYTLEVRDASGTVTVATYQAPLATLNLGGAALVVLASGFLSPAMNSNGPGFGLWVALPAGGPLLPLPMTTGMAETTVSRELLLAPNPTTGLVRLSSGLVLDGSAQIIVRDATGREVMSLSEQALTDQGFSMDLTALRQGSYWLQVIVGGRTGMIALQKI